MLTRTEEALTKDLVFGGGHIHPLAESPTGFALCTEAHDTEGNRYETAEPCDPCDGDNVADATFAAMERIQAYVARKRARQLLLATLAQGISQNQQQHMLRLLYEHYHFANIDGTTHVSHDNVWALVDGKRMDFAHYTLCAAKNPKGREAFVAERVLPRGQICKQCRVRLSFLRPGYSVVEEGAL